MTVSPPKPLSPPKQFGSSAKLVLFDLDGTLVDGQHSIRATFDQIFPAFGFPKPEAEAVRRVVGRSLALAIGDLLGPSAPSERMAEAYKAHFHVMRSAPGYHEEIYPGVDETLRRLAQRSDVVLGTATGKALRGIHWLVDRNNWQGIFTTLQASDTAASKPAPDMVLNACRETGILPADTLVIGDSIFDMQMAVSAGASAVGVRWGYGGEGELIDAGACRMIDSFSQVEDMVNLHVAGLLQKKGQLHA